MCSTQAISAPFGGFVRLDYQGCEVVLRSHGLFWDRTRIAWPIMKGLQVIERALRADAASRVGARSSNGARGVDPEIMAEIEAGAEDEEVL